MSAGRKTILTKELIHKFERLLSAGNYVVTTCGTLGVSQSAYYDWLKKGETAKNGLYAEFENAVKRAEHIAEAKWMYEISQDNAWQSKAWLMERRYPERWGRKDNLALAHSGDLKVSFIPVETLTDEEWEKRESE
jgi:transposase